jgi:CRP-like cAMP-binding protein
MHQSIKDEPHPLVRKLESIFRLVPEEEAALRALPMMERQVPRNHDIVRDGDRPSQCCLLLDGFLYRYKTSPDAKRQILAFHMPGEIPDLQSLYLRTMDHSVGALSKARVGFIQHSVVFDLMTRFPRIAGAFWRETLIDAAVFREWVVNLGIRAAPQRLAHLMAEMYLRLQSIGLAQDGSVLFPATQEELADTLGVSAVHANRALQELRAQGLLGFEAGKLTVPDWDRLAEYCDFDPTYLHLDPNLRR